MSTFLQNYEKELSKKERKKQIRQNRLWEHFKGYVCYPIFDDKMRKIENYDPERWRDAFFRYQTYGRKSISEEERNGIKPLIDGQGNKEIFINSLILETMEFDARWWGWIHPINHTLQTGVDRLTKVALLKIRRALAGVKRANGKLTREQRYGFFDRLDAFYSKHPVSKLNVSEFQKKIQLAIDNIPCRT